MSEALQLVVSLELLRVSLLREQRVFVEEPLLCPEPEDMPETRPLAMMAYSA